MVGVGGSSPLGRTKFLNKNAAFSGGVFVFLQEKIEPVAGKSVPWCYSVFLLLSHYLCGDQFGVERIPRKITVTRVV